MKTLPVTPVETLATLRTAAPVDATGRTANPGIVPPWLRVDATNGGIVPPWLEQRPAVELPARNPGIVPPWLQGRPVGPDQPVGDDVPRILGGVATAYDPTPVVVDDNTPRIWAV